MGTSATQPSARDTFNWNLNEGGCSGINREAARQIRDEKATGHSGRPARTKRSSRRRRSRSTSRGRPCHTSMLVGGDVLLFRVNKDFVALKAPTSFGPVRTGHLGHVGYPPT